MDSRYTQVGPNLTSVQVCDSPIMRTLMVFLRMVRVVPMTRTEKMKVQMGSANLRSGRK